jgi:hypothetical protein
LAVNVFDQAARYCVRADPLGFLSWLLRGVDPLLKFHGWLDTRTVPFPGSPDRMCDTVADLAATAEDILRWAIITEFQTEPDPLMLDRLLEYLARIRRALRFGPQQRERYQVIAALVNLTGPPQPDLLRMALPGLTAPALRFSVAVRTVRDEGAVLTLDHIAEGVTSRCLLGWISLMRGGAEPGIIERWKELANQEPNDQHRATFGAIVTLFAELTDCAAMWKSGLEGWNMRESMIVAEWKAEGRAEGIAEGMAKGRAEGVIQGERRALLTVLERKFGSPIPAGLVATIEAQAELDAIGHWLGLAVAAESLEAFQAAIIRPTNGTA